jgi:phosphoribosylglycinamide formyltransferase-1
VTLPTGKLRVAILISGRGSNMAAIARACAAGNIDAEVVAVIADQAGAPGIALAETMGLPTRIIPASHYPDRDAFEAALEEALRASRAQLVALAGFMRILSAAFVQRYQGRMLNIHPSLLPNYRGLNTHRRVLAAGDAEHGVSVHFVSAELDAGPIICQARLPVRPEDTEESLTARIHTLEHRIYPGVIGLIAAGRLRLEGGSILLDGEPLAAPLTENEAHAQAQ